MVILDILFQWFLVSWIAYFIVGSLVNFDTVNKRIAYAYAISVLPVWGALYALVKINEFSKEESVSLLCKGWKKEFRPYSHSGNGWISVGMREFIIPE